MIDKIKELREQYALTIEALRRRVIELEKLLNLAEEEIRRLKAVKLPS